MSYIRRLPCYFLLLISGLIPLWSKNKLFMISILLICWYLSYHLGYALLCTFPTSTRKMLLHCCWVELSMHIRPYWLIVILVSLLDSFLPTGSTSAETRMWKSPTIIADLSVFISPLVSSVFALSNLCCLVHVHLEYLVYYLLLYLIILFLVYYLLISVFNASCPWKFSLLWGLLYLILM